MAIVPFAVLPQAQDTAIPEVAVERLDESTLLLQDESARAESQQLSVSPFGLWDLLRMLLVLACVIGVIYLVFYLLKRSGKGRLGATDSIRVLGTQNLPGNRAMYLIEVGSQVFLVGSGGDSVSLISEITDRETVDSLILGAGEAATTTRRGFGELISGVLGGAQGSSLDFMRRQREKLHRLGND